MRSRSNVKDGLDIEIIEIGKTIYCLLTIRLFIMNIFQIFKKIKVSKELQECKDHCRHYGILARKSLHVFEHSPPREALFKIINATTVS